jgi:hypothetical protein
MASDLVAVYRAFSSADAQLIRSRLEAAGLAAEVFHELSALSLDGYSLAAGGIQVMVRAEDAAEARRLIEAADSGDEEAPQ